MPEAERMSDAQSMFDAVKTHGLEKVKITGNWIEFKAPGALRVTREGGDTQEARNRETCPHALGGKRCMISSTVSRPRPSWSSCSPSGWSPRSGRGSGTRT